MSPAAGSLRRCKDKTDRVHKPNRSDVRSVMVDERREAERDRREPPPEVTASACQTASRYGGSDAAYTAPLSPHGPYLGLRQV